MTTISESYVVSIGKKMAENMLINSNEVEEVNDYCGRVRHSEAFLFSLCNRKKVGLIYLAKPQIYTFPRFPLGISYIANSLRNQNKSDVYLFDLQLISINEFIKNIKEYNLDILGISMTFGLFDVLKDVIIQVKSVFPKLKIVIGGSLAAIDYVEILKLFPDVIVSLGEGEVLSICNPTYPDQLLGGWMRAVKEGKERTVKRRSPLSISAMHPLHPLLVSKSKENITFDRSDRPEVHKVKVRDSQGNELSEEQIEAMLSGTDRSLLRKWIPDNYRATGLFVYDIAIDLRTLFCVSTNQFEPEISKEMIASLEEKGWVKSKNVFGECLVLPKAERDKLIPALAKALINWRITSNQARTFSLMETLAVAISDNANTLAAAIRAKLIDDGERPKAKPIVDETAGASLFISLPCSNYIVTENESADALQQAEKKLIDMMMAFDYENQL